MPTRPERPPIKNQGFSKIEVAGWLLIKANIDPMPKKLATVS
jgi:hypothetical protein